MDSELYSEIRVNGDNAVSVNTLQFFLRFELEKNTVKHLKNIKISVLLAGIRRHIGPQQRDIDVI